MCDFPSWIVTPEGEAKFLTDDIIEAKEWNMVDSVGHSAIERYFGIKGIHAEHQNVPYEFQQAIRNGECKKMMKAGGFDQIVWKGVHEISEGHILAFGTAVIKASGKAKVTCADWVTVEAKDESYVVARGFSTVTAYGNSTVTARDSSKVTACDSSTVTARDSSTVTARDSSTVTACDSSKVTAYDNSTVKACDSSTVTARDSSKVTACGSSTVTARDSSTVTAGTNPWDKPTIIDDRAK